MKTQKSVKNVTADNCKTHITHQVCVPNLNPISGGVPCYFRLGR